MMFKNILAFCAMSFSMSYAQYYIDIPLSDIDIEFKNNGEWGVITTYVTNREDPFDCYVYPPDPSFFDISNFYITSQHQYNSCKYHKVKVSQQGQYNSVLDKYRYIGNPVEEIDPKIYTKNIGGPVATYLCAYDTPSASKGGFFITESSDGSKHVTWDGKSYNLGQTYSFQWNNQGKMRDSISAFYQAKQKTISNGIKYSAVCIRV